MFSADIGHNPMRKLLSGLLFLVITGCGIPACRGPTRPVSETKPFSRLRIEEGRKIYSSLNCALCHGPRGEGTSAGPPLMNLHRFWSMDRLMGFLENPSSYSDDPRLQRLRKKYQPIRMPAFSLEEKNLENLVLFLLYGIEESEL